MNSAGTMTNDPELESTPIWFLILQIIALGGNVIVCICGVLLITAILSLFFQSPHQGVNNVSPPSHQSYNLYLLFILIPDTLLNAVEFIGFISYKILGNKYPPVWSYSFVWVFTFYYLSNFWLNGVISYQVYRLAKRSHQRMKTDPPLLRQVYKEVCCVYTIAALISTWHVLPDISPVTMVDCEQLILHYGSDIMSETAALLIAFSFIILPTAYVTYVKVSIWRQKLLPQRGRTRILSLYFLRILVLFFGFYFPTVAVAAVYSAASKKIIWHYVAAITLSFLFVFQALTAMYMVTQKPDIRKAVQSILCRVLHWWQCHEGGERPVWIKQMTSCSNSSAVANDGAPETRNDAEAQTSEDTQENPQCQLVVDDEWEAEDVYDDSVTPRRRFTLPITLPTSALRFAPHQNEMDNEFHSASTCF